MNLALSPFAVTVALITLLVGALTTAINTGKFLGQFTVPAKAMVWLLIIAPFLAAVLASLQQANGLSTASIFNAVIAGLTAVLAGSSPGIVTHVALHAHLAVPKLAAQFRAPPKTDNTQAAPAKAA